MHDYVTVESPRRPHTLIHPGIFVDPVLPWQKVGLGLSIPIQRMCFPNKRV